MYIYIKLYHYIIMIQFDIEFYIDRFDLHFCPLASHQPLYKPARALTSSLYRIIGFFLALEVILIETKQNQLQPTRLPFSCYRSVPSRPSVFPSVRPIKLGATAPRRKVSTGPRRESVRNRATFNPLQLQQKKTLKINDIKK